MKIIPSKLSKILAGVSIFSFVGFQCVLPSKVAAQPSPVIAIKETSFTLDQKPFDFTGVSFFNALYNDSFNVSESEQIRWLKKFKDNGISVLRIWAEWNNDLGFVDVCASCRLYDNNGGLQQQYLSRLKRLLVNTAAENMVVEFVFFSSESKGKKL